MNCECGNAARYIDETGALCCGICPLKQHRDSIKIADVPQLLGWARLVIEYFNANPMHIPAFDSMRAMLGNRAALPGPGNENCNCSKPNWGGHSGECRYLREASMAIEKPLPCDIEQPIGWRCTRPLHPTTQPCALVTDKEALQKLRDELRKAQAPELKWRRGCGGHKGAVD